MNAIEHYNRNHSFGKPKGWTDEECFRLHIQAGVLPIGPEGRKEPVILSAWKLSPEELARINETGIVWLSIVGQGMPPVNLYTDNPLPDTGVTYDTEKDTWVHGQPIGEGDARYLGPCPKCGERTISTDVVPGAAWHCTSVYCENFTTVPVPEGHDLYPWWWNKGYILRKDGTSWMAALPDFQNLQVSPAGFGECPEDAINGLLLEFNGRQQ